MKKIEIFCIGTELISFNKIDTNSLWLAEKLESLGFEINAKYVIKDDKELIKRFIEQGLLHADILITIGGLGPTQDDITRQALCEAMNKELIFSKTIWESIEERFKRRKRPIPDITKVQAYIPEGAEYLVNNVGTAPGTWTSYQNKIIIMLPGPPPELKPMFENEVMPRLIKMINPPQPAKLFYGTAGLPESVVEEKLAPFYQKFPDVKVTLLAAPWQVDIYVIIENENARKVAEIANNANKEITSLLGDYIFTRTEKGLEEVIGELLRTHKKTLAIAESCTGGLLGSRITNVPGSSDYFERGIISYSNDAKIELLDVPRQLIDTYGAVSEEVAVAMAEGIKKNAHVDYGIAITGIAGPTGSTPTKPVGTVHIAVATEKDIIHQHNIFAGNRQQIKYASTQIAFNLLRKYLMNLGQEKD